MLIPAGTACRARFIDSLSRPHVPTRMMAAMTRLTTGSIHSQQQADNIAQIVSGIGHQGQRTGCESESDFNDNETNIQDR